MTKEQLLDFCKSQNWSTEIEIYEENFRRLRIDRFLIISDIGIHNARANIPFEIDKSTEEITINSITFYDGINPENVSGKTYYAHPKNDIEICDFIKNSVERHKKFSSRLAQSTITKLQNKIEQLQNEIERIKLFI